MLYFYLQIVISSIKMHLCLFFLVIDVLFAIGKGVLHY